MYGLKEFTEINAVSGNEKDLRNKIRTIISPYADSITVDTMGNLIAFKKGKADNGKKVILSAHMDEVGFIISDITEDGFLKFKSVGGIDPRILLAQRVCIGDNKISGVLGVKAVHLQSPSERKSVIKEKDMYIDIGAPNKKEAEKLVSKGDYGAFDSAYTELGDGVIKAKALDDRAGCVILSELLKGEYECDIYFCFCVQEEVGLRGAKVLSRRINADVAVILEATTCSDIAGVKPHEYATVFGSGPVISIMDRASYSDKKLNEFICKLADDNNISYQFKKTTMGGNDAGSYQSGSLACKTAVISLPCRYIHSPVSCCKTEDFESMFSLAKKLAENIHNFK